MGVTIGYNGDTIAGMSASGTKTLLTAGKYCADDITVAYQDDGGEPMPNYRRIEGTISDNIVGSNTVALLLTSDVLAAHWNDASLRVTINFTPNPNAAYAIIRCSGYNTANSEPYNGSHVNGTMQYTYRQASSIGSFNGGAIPLAVSDAAETKYVGRIVVDAQGHLYLRPGSDNYGFRKGTYVAEISW